MKSSTVYPDHFDADPDSYFLSDADSDADPDTTVQPDADVDPDSGFKKAVFRIRIHPKMSWIRNTEKKAQTL